MQRPPSPSRCWIVASALILFACEPPEKPATQVNTPQKPNPAEETLTSAPEYSPAWLSGDFGFVTIQAPDGASERLQIIEQDVDVVITGRLARTTIEQVFKNHTLAHQQGTYTLDMPRGARVASLTITIGDDTSSARVVEDKRVLAEPVEQLPIVRSPDLVFDSSRETFTTELAAIPPGRIATVSLTYDRVLETDGDRVLYRYEMPALDAQDPSIPRIPNFQFDLGAPGAKDLSVAGYNLSASAKDAGSAVSLVRKRFVPLGPIEVSKPVPKARAHVSRAPEGDAFLLDLAIEQSSDARTPPENLVLVLDTSAGSGQKALDHSVAFSKSLLTALEAANPNATVTILTSDLTTRTCATRGKPSEVSSCLADLNAVGASDLGALANTLGKELANASAPTHVLYLGDGAATIGEVSPSTLVTAFQKALGAKHRLHTVSVGQRADENLLRALAHRGSGFAYGLTSAEAASEDATRVLEAISTPPIKIERVEVSKGSLERLSTPAPFTLIPGESLLLAGMASEDSELVLKGERGGEPFEKKISLAAAPEDVSDAIARFEARRWLESRILDGASREELVSIATEGQVQGPHTAFITFESRAAGFEDSHDALERISQHMFSVADVASVAKPKKPSRGQPEEPSAKSEDASKEEDVSLRERVEDLDAAAETAAAVGEKLPLQQAAPLVSATCPATQITATMKSRQGVLSSCFRGQLRSKFKPSGRVAFSWEIDPIGRADKVSVLDSSIENKLVLRCLERVITRTRFENQSDFCFVVQAYAYDDSAEEPLSSRAIIERKVTALEERSAELSMDEDIDLLEKLVLLGDRARATAWLGRMKERHANRSVLLLLRSPITQEYFDKEFRDGVHRVLAKMKAGNLLASRAAVQIAERKDVDEFFKLFATGPIEPAIAVDALVIMSSQMPSIVPRVWDRWESIYPPKRRYGMFLALEDGKKRWPELHLRALLGMQGSSDLTRSRLEEALEVVITLGKQKEHVELFATSCAKNALDRGWCLMHMDAFAAALGEEKTDALREKLKRNQRAELDSLRARRSGDMGNPILIVRMAQLHDELGERDQARRVLSEIVEFAPKASSAHQRFASELEERGAILDACASYGRAFTLDPRREEVSIAWENLFTANPQHTADLQKCVIRTLESAPVAASKVVVAFAKDRSESGALEASLEPLAAGDGKPQKLARDAVRVVGSTSKSARGFAMLFLGELPAGSYEVRLSGVASQGDVMILGEEGEATSRVSFTLADQGDKPKTVTTLTLP